MRLGIGLTTFVVIAGVKQYQMFGRDFLSLISSLDHVVLHRKFIELGCADSFYQNLLSDLNLKVCLVVFANYRLCFIC